MRRLLTGLVVVAIVGAMPLLALADNQEIANDIAKSLRDSGRLEHYKIGVRYQEGTAWVRGYVSDQQQMAAALNLVASTKGVDRVINELQIGVAQVQPQPVAVAPSPPQTQSLRSATLTQDDTNNVRTADLASPSSQTPAPQTKIRLATTSTEEPRQVQTLGKPSGSQPVSQAMPVGQLTRVVMQTSAPVPHPSQRMVAQQAQFVGPQRPIPVAFTQAQPMPQQMGQVPGGPMPAYAAGMGGGVAPAQYDQPYMPNHAWPSYAAYPNYAAVTYPRQHSPAAWPYIGPFYPYPQVPLGWRKVTLEWDDGWWMLDFNDSPRRCKW